MVKVGNNFIISPPIKKRPSLSKAARVGKLETRRLVLPQSRLGHNSKAVHRAYAKRALQVISWDLLGNS